VNATGVPNTARTVTVCAPDVVPRVCVVRARPFASVVRMTESWFVPTLPPPAVTTNRTEAPATGLAKRSRTCTTSALGSAVSTVSLCAAPESTTIALGASGTPVRLKETGIPTSPGPVAVKVAGPTVFPSVGVALACPDALVKTVTVSYAPNLPPPAVALKSTGMPASVTLAPAPSTSFTVRGTPTAAPTVSVCGVPETTLRCASCTITYVLSASAGPPSAGSLKEATT
jgi:hypothetical protein